MPTKTIRAFTLTVQQSLKVKDRPLKAKVDVLYDTGLAGVSTGRESFSVDADCSATMASILAELKTKLADGWDVAEAVEGPAPVFTQSADSQRQHAEIVDAEAHVPMPPGPQGKPGF